jgi:hypothetical protein
MVTVSNLHSRFPTLFQLPSYAHPCFAFADVETRRLYCIMDTVQASWDVHRLEGHLPKINRLVDNRG